MADQQRLQISELHFFFKKILTLNVFILEVRFKTQVSSCSCFPSEAMILIKEVEMVDSVDDFKSPRSIKSTQFPNFEMLDGRTASSLNKIVQSSFFKKKVSLEDLKAQKEDRFLWRKTDRLHDLLLLSSYLCS